VNLAKPISASHRARPIMTTAPRFELLTGNNDNLGFAVRLKK
jgi:hypothetical protein